MKYIEMVKFLHTNCIDSAQFVIASEVNAQLTKSIDYVEFEEICHKIYMLYLGSVEEPDIWDAVNEELMARGYKS